MVFTQHSTEEEYSTISSIDAPPSFTTTPLFTSEIPTASATPQYTRGTTYDNATHILGLCLGAFLGVLVLSGVSIYLRLRRRGGGGVSGQRDSISTSERELVSSIRSTPSHMPSMTTTLVSNVCVVQVHTERTHHERTASESTSLARKTEKLRAMIYGGGRRSR